MGTIFERLFTKLKRHYLPVSKFEPVAQPKLRLRHLVKSIKAEPLGLRKMFQSLETKVSSLSLRPG